MAGVSDNPFRHLFAAGGASGGSVGIVSTVAQRLAPVAEATDWVKALGDDHVGPLLSQAVIGELTVAAWGVAPAHDRAEVLIDGWASPFTSVGASCPPLAGAPVDEIGFLQLHGACPGQVPLMLLNGTVVGSGQRFNISPLDGSAAPGERLADSWAAGSIDLLDVLCPGRDLPLFDAAFLSARFPFATPSGRLLEAGKGCARDIESAVDVVDGGYLENSGAGQIGELYGVLAPLLRNYEAARPPGYRPVRVVLVRIENGERSGVPDGPPSLESHLAEPLRVPEAQLGIMTGGGQSQVAMQGLLTAAERDGVEVLEFALYAHPGRRLPLGWALTKAIFDDIEGVYQLDLNEQAAERFRTAITPRPT